MGRVFKRVGWCSRRGVDSRARCRSLKLGMVGAEGRDCLNSLPESAMPAESLDPAAQVDEIPQTVKVGLVLIELHEEEL